VRSDPFVDLLRCLPLRPLLNYEAAPDCNGPVALATPFGLRAAPFVGRRPPVPPPAFTLGRQEDYMTRSRGFTLLELMVTMAIISILAAIAIPSYSEYVRRSRITEAFATLSGMRVKMEQHFQDNRTYATACGAPPSVAPLPPPTQNFTYDCPALGPNNYTVRARGIAGTSVDGFTYTIDDQNARTTAMAAPSNWPGNGGCWVIKRDGSC